MRSVTVGNIALAVVIAVAVGVGVGLFVGFAARHLGWSTGFVGPLTGGIVSTLTAVIYQVRAARSARGHAEQGVPEAPRGKDEP